MPKRVKKSKYNGNEIEITKRWRPWRPPSDLLEVETNRTHCELNPCNILSGVIGAEIIPYFDPEKNDIGTEHWINKIDQFGAAHNWSEEMKSYFMQTRLTGIAKVWHASLQGYDMSWRQWKEELKQAFPSKVDFVELLREMLNRRKQPNESMTQYFYHKYSLLNRLEISGEKAVSCIIDGLPQFMRVTARAGNFATPSDLYAKFLIVMPEKYKTINSSSKEVTSNQYTAVKEKKIVCFLCQEAGHIVKRCPRNKADKPTCETCGKNHRSENCWQRNKLQTTTINKPDDTEKVSLDNKPISGERVYVETETQVNENEWKDEKNEKQE